MMKLFDEIPTLESDFLIIKKIEEKDAAVIEEMAGNENVTRYLPTFLFEYQFEDKNEAVRKMYDDIFREKESLFLGIFPNNGKMAGVCEIYNYDEHWNKASVGVRLNEDSWHKGIASETIRLIKEYLFDNTDIRRITAHVMGENIYSSKAVEKAGFRLRKKNAPEDWGFDEPVLVNKYVLEKLGNIKYKKIGNGAKPMVMLPGLALKTTLGSVDLIAENYDMFSDYSIYLFDDRDGIEEGYTIRERAGDIAAEMKTLHVKHACVFGASMGGMVGQYLAIDHPDLVEKMVISSTCPCMNELSRNVIGRWREMAETGRVSDLIKSTIKDIYSESTVAKWGDALVNGIGHVTEEDIKKYVMLCDAVLGFDSRDELPKLSCELLVIGSEGDRVLGPEGSSFIAESTGGRVYMYGTEYGHGVYDEAPDHRQRILDFFGRGNTDI